MTPTAPGPLRDDTRLLWGLAVVLVFARVAVLWMHDPHYDDAFITWRVARNVARGLGPVFHAGERVQVVTSLPHTLLCALAYRLFGDGGMVVDRALACVLDGFAFHALATTLAAEVDFPTRSRRVALGAFALLYALTLQAALVVPAGLETGLYLVCAARALREAGRGRDLYGGAWSGACALVRPEGALLVLALVVCAGSLSRALRVGGSATAVALPALVAVWAYFGSVVPQSVVAKSLLVHSARGEWSALVRTFAWGQGRAWFGALMAVGCAVALTRRGLARVIVWGILLGGCLASFTPLWPWYYAPLALVAAWAFGLGAGALHRAVSARAGRVQAEASWVAAAAVSLALLVSYGAGELVAAGRRQAASRAQDVRIARYLRVHAGPHASILAERVGVLAYVSDLRFEDYPGLTSPRVTDALRARALPVGFGPSDTEALGAVLRDVRPTHLVLRSHELLAARGADLLADYRELAVFPADPSVAASSSEHTDMTVLVRTSRLE